MGWAGAGLSSAGSISVDVFNQARLSGGFRLSCGFGFRWFLSGCAVGLWTAASGVLILPINHSTVES